MNVQEIKKTPRPRYCGILVHPTSFPSPYGIGDLGDGAYAFIDFLYDAGQTLWQCLPLGPTGFGDSPYQAFSAFAGQPLLISPDLLLKDGLLEKDDLADVPDFNDYSVEYGNVITYKSALLRKACAHFTASEDKALHKAFNHFCRTEKDWLEDYALFMSLKDLHQGRSWHEWSPQYQFLDTRTRKAALTELADSITYYQFIQFIFFKQWHELKLYANKKGISVIGDIPIYVAMDSADTWANPWLFKLDEKNCPTQVAGCPPDGFSATGQLWGNPLYNWEVHRNSGYEWWIKRIANCFRLYDVVRIDHFRGFDEYYAIPYGDATAENGWWEKGPGMDLFRTVSYRLGHKDIIAEDLGFMTDSVKRLVEESGYPNMKVIEFAFDERDTGNASDYLPHNYTNNCVVYTGTHDNETLVSWLDNITPQERRQVRKYLNNFHDSGKELCDDLICLVMQSVADLCIIPMQDYLGLDNSARMNQPSTLGKNWKWRLKEGQFSKELRGEMLELAGRYGRL